MTMYGNGAAIGMRTIPMAMGAIGAVALANLWYNESHEKYYFLSVFFFLFH